MQLCELYCTKKRFWRLSLHAHRTRVQVVHIHSCRSCCDTRMTKKIKNADLDTVRTGKCLIITIHVLICKLMKTSYLAAARRSGGVIIGFSKWTTHFPIEVNVVSTRSRVEKNEFKYPLYFSLGYEYVLMVPQYT